MPKRKTLIVSDFDRTLVDAIELHKRASAEIFTPYNLEGDMYMVECDGSTHYNISKDCLTQIVGIEPTEKQILEAKSRWVNKEIRLMSKMPIKVYEGVEGLLSLLQEQAYLGLVTGNPEEICPGLLDITGLGKFFPTDVRVFGDMFYHDRGDGNIIEGRVGGIARCLALSRAYYGVDFDAIVYMGDSPKDIEAGNQAKKLLPISVFSAVVLHEGRVIENLASKCPDLVFKDFKEYGNVARQLLGVDNSNIS